MRIIPAFLFIAFFSASAIPAVAGQTVSPYTGGLHYSRVSDAPKSDDSTIKLRTIQREDEQQAAEKPESSRTRIWNKYKALAAGKAEKDTEKDKKENEETAEDKAQTVEKTEPENKIAAEPAPENTGLAGLINEYRRNKAQRSQMRTITITAPEKTGKTEEKENTDEKPGN